MKKIAGFVLAGLFWIWSALPRIMDAVGRTTFMDDAGELVGDKLPALFDLLVQAPWWVPPALAMLLTGWMFYITIPESWRRTKSPSIDLGREPLTPPTEWTPLVEVAAEALSRTRQQPGYEFIHVDARDQHHRLERIATWITKYHDIWGKIEGTPARHRIEAARDQWPMFAEDGRLVAVEDPVTKRPVNFVDLEVPTADVERIIQTTLKSIRQDD